MTVRTTAIDRYVVDTLLRDVVGHDHRPSAFLVYLYLATRHDHPRGRPPVQLSHAELARAVGISRSAVQGAIGHLKRRRLIRIERESPTATPRYEVLSPWRR
ncbi:MAG: helix-turn-helix domain-containing protein [Gemmatimonadales bacterium]